MGDKIPPTSPTPLQNSRKYPSPGSDPPLLEPSIHSPSTLPVTVHPHVHQTHKTHLLNEANPSRSMEPMQLSPDNLLHSYRPPNTSANSWNTPLILCGTTLSVSSSQGAPTLWVNQKPATSPWEASTTPCSYNGGSPINSSDVFLNGEPHPWTSTPYISKFTSSYLSLSILSS